MAMSFVKNVCEVNHENKKENIYWGEIPFYMSIIAAMVFVSWFY